MKLAAGKTLARNCIQRTRVNRHLTACFTLARGIQPLSPPAQIDLLLLLGLHETREFARQDQLRVVGCMIN